MANKKRRNKCQPVIGVAPCSPAVRTGGSPDSFAKQSPSWHFALLDYKGPFNAQALTAEALWLKILPKLKNFESMTWGEIESASGGRKCGNNNHFIAVDKLAKEARSRLAQLKQDDVDELFSLRLSGRERLFGLRVGRVFKIIWYDPDHRICEVKR